MPTLTRLWLSCVSSDGNYIMLCPAGGGPCYGDSFVAPEANAECAKRGHSAPLLE
jgi:hypothetical protein